MGNLSRFGIGFLCMVLGQFAFIDFGDLEWWRRAMGFLSFAVAWELIRMPVIDVINEMEEKTNHPWG